MANEVVQYIEPRAGGRYVDATLGGGGHAAAILEAAGPGGWLLGVDRDQEAIDAASVRLAEFGERAQVVQGRYGQLVSILDEAGYGHEVDGRRRVDGIVVDAGVSSHQLDTVGRGFSFREAGPLDMRMSQTGQTAGDLLDTLEVGQLAKILKDYGEVRRAGRVARAIIEARAQGRAANTAQLAAVVADITPGGVRFGRIHPATQVFQALRIAVNGELDDLDAFCQSLPDLLAEGGVAVVISFHSLEDRIVKRAFNSLSKGPDIPSSVPLTDAMRPRGPLEVLTRKPVRPSETEVDSNPRARSARLRAARCRVTQTGRV